MRTVKGNFWTHQSFLSLSVHNYYLFFFFCFFVFCSLSLYLYLHLSHFNISFLCLSYLHRHFFFILSSVLSLGGKVLWCPHVKQSCAEASSKMGAMKTRRQIGLPACRARPRTHIWQQPDWFLFWNSIRWQAHEVGGTFCKPLLQDYGHKWKNRFGDVYSVWNGHIFQNRSLQFRTEPWDWIWLFVSTSLSKGRTEITGK